MSVSGYAFINDDGIVVQAIGGELDVVQQAQFLRDYSVIFGATQMIEVQDGTSVWIGGSYTDGVFAPPPPPPPDPNPILIYPNEVIEEPEATETPDDSIPS
jgi:hypothetical protein